MIIEDFKKKHLRMILALQIKINNQEPIAQTRAQVLHTLMVNSIQ